MGEEKVGEVFTYFSKVGVAAIKLTEGSLSAGDKIHIRGATTNFEQLVESMQIEHASVQRAEKGASAGIKVKNRVRTGDGVYKVTP